MHTKLFTAALCLPILAACMSTSPQLGPDASAWEDYLAWHKVTAQAETGDPTGFLNNVHDGDNAYRQIYINSIGESTNKGEANFPYPEGTIIVKESFNNKAALDARRNPDLTLMIKLPQGQSPETAGWEYVMGGNGSRRGTGSSGLGQFCFQCHLQAAATDFNFINSKFYESR